MNHSSSLGKGITNLVTQAWSRNQASRRLTNGTTTLAPSDAQGRPARSRENFMADARSFPGKGYYSVNPRVGQPGHSPIIIFRKDQQGLCSSPVTQSTGGVAYSSGEGAIRQTGIGWHSPRRRTPRQAPGGLCIHPIPQRAITATCIGRLTGTNRQTTTSSIKATSKHMPLWRRTYLPSTLMDRLHRTWPSECAPTHEGDVYDPAPSSDTLISRG